MTIGDYFLAALGIIMINVVINFTWICIFKINVEIKLPIPSKYVGKKEPIYNYDANWFGSESINKYTLQYRNHEGFFILNCILFPFPINWMKYGYERENLVWIEEGKSIESIKNLGTYYEKIIAAENKIKQQKDKKHNKKQNHINKLNKEFTDNFI